MFGGGWLRLVHVKLLVETAHAIGWVRFWNRVCKRVTLTCMLWFVGLVVCGFVECRFDETKENIITLLEDRLQDSEQAVRQHLAGQLEGLAKVRLVLLGVQRCDVCNSTYHSDWKSTRLNSSH